MIKQKKYISDIPELIAEWDWESNNELGLDPTKLTHGSGQKAHWICSKGHKWESTISNRAFGNSCPYCSGRLPIVGVTDLATTHPELSKQWHPTKNGNLKPTDVTFGSGKKVWWKCAVCGHEWSAMIVSRTCHNTGCLVCESKKRKLPVPIKFNTIVKMQKAKELTVMAALQCLNMSRATYYRRIKELQL